MEQRCAPDGTACLSSFCRWKYAWDAKKRVVTAGNVRPKNYGKNLYFYQYEAKSPVNI